MSGKVVLPNLKPPEVVAGLYLYTQHTFVMALDKDTIGYYEAARDYLYHENG